MKKIFSILTLATLIGLSACDEDAFKDNIALGESINDFSLTSPANFSSLLLNASQNDKVIGVQWDAAVTGLETPPTYRFLLDEKGGDFSSPLLSVESDNAGADSELSLTYGDLIAAISGATSTEYIWTVEAKVETTEGTNKHNARTSFDLGLTVSSEGISDFSYLAPAVNEKLAFDKFATPSDVIEFSWGAATSLSGDPVSFTIQFDNPGNDFSNPLYESTSDNSGVDAMFSITHSDLKDLLDGITYEDGLNWRVVATVGGFEYSPGMQYVRFNPADAGPANLYLVGGSSTAGWDPSVSIPFVNLEEGKWEIYAYLDPAGGGVKFLEVQDWPGDWGMSPGNPGALEQDGEDNVTVPTIGFYRIFVDFTTGTYSTEEVNWGIIGSATPNGWGDPDTDMTYVGGPTDLYTWEASVTLVDGEIKFRANDGWDINYGDNGADGSLEPGGDNIAVTAGDYIVKLILDPTTGFTYNVIGATASIYLVGAGVPDAGWGWGSPIELIQIEPGVYEATNVTFAVGAFRVFAIDGDWGSGTNYPTYISDGYAISSNFEDAMDGDNNFQFNGTPGAFKFTLNENTKTIVATVGLSKYLVGAGVPDAGWGWTSPIELAQIEAGVYEATTEFANGAFRVFATDGDWGSGTNYPTYISNGYTIDADFEDALDGDNNFQFVGTPGDHRFVLDENSQTITLF